MFESTKKPRTRSFVAALFNSTQRHRSIIASDITGPDSMQNAAETLQVQNAAENAKNTPEIFGAQGARKSKRRLLGKRDY